MANYTIELRKALEVPGFELFDFEYPRSVKSDEILPKKDLEQGFIDHFYFREIGFETLEKFKYRFMTEWRENIGELDINIIAYGSENINVKSTAKVLSQSTNIDNDTPKNSLDYGEESKHASFIGNIKTTSNGYSGITEVELLDKLVKYYHDVQTEFYEKFDKLFMQIL